jgi:hypothetical protein
MSSGNGLNEKCLCVFNQLLLYILLLQPAMKPRMLMHFEGFVGLAFSLFAYYYIGGRWLLFMLLIFVPDIFMLGYLKGDRIGSLVYNAFHIYLWPAAFAISGILLGSRLLIEIGIIFFAHINMDRMLGLGLKYPTYFRDTHFQRL